MHNKLYQHIEHFSFEEFLELELFYFLILLAKNVFILTNGSS